MSMSAATTETDHNAASRRPQQKIPKKSGKLLIETRHSVRRPNKKIRGRPNIAGADLVSCICAAIGNNEVGVFELWPLLSFVYNTACLSHA